MTGFSETYSSYKTAQASANDQDLHVCPVAQSTTCIGPAESERRDIPLGLI